VVIQKVLFNIKLYPTDFIFIFIDYVVLGTDSGQYIVLEYKDGRFVKVIQEPYGKTGCSRAIPGQYLAADSQGRAVMLGSFYGSLCF
jgi:Mono-functional DNA-alkylating methyl methanesulfonate N-term